VTGLDNSMIEGLNSNQVKREERGEREVEEEESVV
jgi:hypothetical protein